MLPSRLPGYTPRLLDELGAMGEVAWVGRGALGRDDGRIALYRPGREILRPQAPVDANDDAAARPAGPRHDGDPRTPPDSRRELLSSHPRCGGRWIDREMLDALWDLVWAGEVTNDTFAPLRALRWKRPSGSGSGARRGRPGRLTALGPPEAAGRWSLVEPLEDTPPTERLHAQTLALLERHGVLTREAVAAEPVNGGFSAVYPVLRALEEAGRIRRGYFVDGLGAAQFALAGALDRLRAVRDGEEGSAAPAVYVLAAADPANPYGAALPWPRRGDDDRRPFQRAAGAYVVLVDGVAAAVSGARRLDAADPSRGRDPNIADSALRGLTTLVATGRFREMVIRKVDGVAVADSPWRDRLLEAGFTAGYRGLTLRQAR